MTEECTVKGEDPPLENRLTMNAPPRGRHKNAAPLRNESERENAM